MPLPPVMVVTDGVGPVIAIDGAMIQLRAKDAGAAELERRARAIAGRAVLSINVGGAAIDAAAAGADYLHLPETAPVEGWPLPFGRSVHSATEARRCACAYLVAGPVWPTPGKPSAIGVEGLRAIVEAAGAVPVFAIGGILDATNALRCRDAGAHGVAGIRAFSAPFVCELARLMTA